MVRVMMLAPFLILLSTLENGATRRTAGSADGATKITIPWFAVGFVLVAGLNSLVSLPPALVSHVNDLLTPSSWPWQWPASASARTSRDPPRRPVKPRCCWPPCYSPGCGCSAVDYSPAWRSPESSARKPCSRPAAGARAGLPASSMPCGRAVPAHWTSPLPG
ncbi:putative sulfate exporter family transporter [Pseudomonas aeruginosa]